jgi:hypothetical protein
MPDKPNYEEFKDAGQGDDKEVVRIFDQRYGSYQEQKPAVASSNMPSKDNPSPFVIKGQ